MEDENGLESEESPKKRKTGMKGADTLAPGSSGRTCGYHRG